MSDPGLLAAVQSVPSGAWGVGVSGGGDSVALLALLHQRADLKLHVIHLDHQLRGQESTHDAEFVADLAAKWGLSCTVARRDQIEPVAGELPSNPSARYRKLRQVLFASVVGERSLEGVILAHHADDQAETVLQRLVRASGAMGLAGMSQRASIGGVVVLRPLLTVRREQLRAYLKELKQPFRVDPSNESPQYLRSRLRRILTGRPGLFEVLLDLSQGCGALRDWVRRCAPRLGVQFSVGELGNLPEVLARESARTWLVERGVPVDAIGPDVPQRMIEMARDAATPARQHFPGRILVMRRRGRMLAEGSHADQSEGPVEG